MGLMSLVGRLLFASVFIFSAWQQFNELGVDGGPSAKALKPKLDLLTDHVASLSGLHIPKIDAKRVFPPAIAFKGCGGLLFVFGSSFGAYFLLLHQAIVTPLLYDFYNYSVNSPDFQQIFVRFIEEVALCGALLFYLGMKKSIRKRQYKTNKGKNPKSKIR